MDWRNVWRGIFPRRMIEPDVRDEIAFHLEERIRELVARGWSEDEARREVLARFGNVETVEEACRTYDAQRVDRMTWRMTMEGWTRDLALAVRSMRRAPGFAAVVVLTLSLGIGASTAVFSVVEGVLLRPLPYEDPQELAIVWQNDRATGTVREPASPSDYFDYVDRSTRFEALGMVFASQAVLSRPGSSPLRVATAELSAGIDDILGIEMQAGRAFLPGEDTYGGPAVVILADGFWRNEFGADPEVVGRTLVVDGSPHEVVGILPPGVEFPAPGTELWRPIGVDRATAQRQSHWTTVVGRLADGSTLADAQAEMTRIMADLEAEYPEANTNRGAFVERLADVGRADLALTLWVLFGSVLTVLLIACVNVANLLLARGAARGRELAVLSAVGAGRSDLVRRFLAEGLLMAGVSAVGGIVLAALGVEVLLALSPPELLGLGEPGLNAPVLGFAMGAALLIGLGFAVLPALQNRRLDLQANLKDGRSGVVSASMPVRRLLVAGQLGLAVVLLVGAALLMGTLRNLQAVDPGFRSANVLRAYFTLPDSRYPSSFADYPDWPVIQQFNRDVMREMAALPGVQSAAIAFNHPLERGFTNSFQIEGLAYDPSQGEMTTRMVTPGYFETVGVRVLEGRVFEESDDAGSEGVVVINRRAKERYFPDGDALGRGIRFWGPTYRRVIGVVENERVHGLTAEPPPAMYVSLLQSPQRGGQLSILLRTEVPPLSLAESVRSTMARIDAEAPVYGVATMEETVREAAARERFATVVLGVFAAVALFLAVLGVHGVLSYLVAQRSHEVGVRMALGATRSDVVRRVVEQGAVMAGLGIAFGLAAALVASSLLQGLLFGVDPVSPVLYGGVAVGLGIVALAASALPARKAASVDPVTALRGD